MTFIAVNAVAFPSTCIASLNVVFFHVTMMTTHGLNTGDSIECKGVIHLWRPAFHLVIICWVRNFVRIWIKVTVCPRGITLTPAMCLTCIFTLCLGEACSVKPLQHSGCRLNTTTITITKFLKQILWFVPLITLKFCR